MTPDERGHRIINPGVKRDEIIKLRMLNNELSSRSDDKGTKVVIGILFEPAGGDQNLDQIISDVEEFATRRGLETVVGSVIDERHPKTRTALSEVVWRLRIAVKG